jgi:hypothetical protein
MVSQPKPRRHSLFIGVVLLIAILVSMAPARGTLAMAPQPVAPAPSTGILSAGRVPLSLRRKAAQLVEDLRSSSMAPNWQQAQLSASIRELYRPDVDGIAYYEFPVVAGAQPAGFIILSTQDHDFPVAHWNSEGESPTQRLARQASAQGKLVQKFYKLDALAYAAEDAQGQLVASSDTKLVKVTGMDADALRTTGELSESSWRPAASASDDSLAALGGELVRTGPKPSTSLKLGTWDSWQSLKAGYRESYSVLAEALRREASSDWTVDQQAAEFGEGLVEGSSYPLALLSTEVRDVAVAGAGARYVSTVLVRRLDLPPVFSITATSSEPGRAVPLDVTVSYTDGQTEVLKFFVVPATASGAQSTASAESDGAAHATSDWSPWTYFWAGYENDQRWYNQISAGTTPNTSGCVSGCGATAWSMLFGWADYQAAVGNSTWVPRWGLYRQNGGYGANAVAPQYMDGGVKNMIWEIRNRIGTFCAFGNGATFPWDMDQASGYLDGRSGTGLTTHYNSFGINENRLRKYALESIRDRHTPAIIGTGWLTHYPLAYGYAFRKRTVQTCVLFVCWDTVETSRWFYVNQGWGGSGNGWVPASVWFAGEIHP